MQLPSPHPHPDALAGEHIQAIAALGHRASGCQPLERIRWPLLHCSLQRSSCRGGAALEPVLTVLPANAAPGTRTPSSSRDRPSLCTAPWPGMEPPVWSWLLPTPGEHLDCCCTGPLAAEVELFWGLYQAGACATGIELVIHSSLESTLSCSCTEGMELVVAEAGLS